MEMAAGDTLVLSSLRLDRFSHLWELYIDKAEPEIKPIEQEQLKKAREEFSSLIQPLITKGIRVVIEAPKPLLYAPPYRCVDWFTRSNSICRFGLDVNREYLLKYRSQILASINVLQDENAVRIWDPFPLLCPGSFCSAFQGNQVLFSDGDHITPRANKVLYENLVQYL